MKSKPLVERVPHLPAAAYDDLSEWPAIEWLVWDRFVERLHP